MRAVLFDLDETLIDRTSAMRRYAAQVWVACTQKPMLQDAFVEEVMTLDRFGYTPRPEFFEAMNAAFGAHLPDRSLIENGFYQEVWETPQLAEGVIACLDTLRERGILTGVVTNGSTRAQQAKLAGSGLAGYMQATVVSEAMGAKKPDPSLYLEAARQLGVDLADCWFVGDNPVNDVWGSKQVGCRAAWVSLDRPWDDAVERCYDVQGVTFNEVMTQVVESLA